MSGHQARSGSADRTVSRHDRPESLAHVRLLLTAAYLVAGGGSVIGHHDWAGPPLLVLTSSRGVTVGDLGIVLLVLIAMRLTWQAPPRRSFQD